ncbi:MAG: hypothetical protein JST19_23205 [Bacteroidetes bacterium]|nr:hypothetical protein [Bacteroidota bacterium]
MKRSTPHSFILVDDDPINNFINVKYMSVAFPGCDTKAFTSSEAALYLLSCIIRWE